MKMLLVCFFFIFSQSGTELTTIRENFKKSAASKTAADEFYASLQDYNKSNATIQGYQASSKMVKARYEQGKEKKKKLFTEGAKTLATLIDSNPSNVEIRLIRLAMQEHSPKVLKYKSEIANDKSEIIALYSKQSSGLKSLIKDYANQSKVFSEVEKKKLN